MINPIDAKSKKINHIIIQSNKLYILNSSCREPEGYFRLKINESFQLTKGYQCSCDFLFLNLSLFKSKQGESP